MFTSSKLFPHQPGATLKMSVVEHASKSTKLYQKMDLVSITHLSTWHWPVGNWCQIHG